jgi:hypothetical protein
MKKKFTKYLTRYFLFIKNNKSTVLLLLTLGVIFDILFVASQYDLITYVILGISIFSILLYKLQSSTIFKFCLILLTIMIIALITKGSSPLTEKAAVWIFFFLWIGVILRLKYES